MALRLAVLPIPSIRGLVSDCVVSLGRVSRSEAVQRKGQPPGMRAGQSTTAPMAFRPAPAPTVDVPDDHADASPPA